MRFTRACWKPGHTSHACDVRSQQLALSSASDWEANPGTNCDWTLKQTPRKPNNMTADCLAKPLTLSNIGYASFSGLPGVLSQAGIYSLTAGE